MPVCRSCIAGTRVLRQPTTPDPPRILEFPQGGSVVPGSTEPSTALDQKMASTDRQGARRMAEQTEKAVLAGGCFWGMQELIRKRPGVLATRVGYSGGDVPNATYRNHGDHAEAVEIVFDPEGISFRDLLEFFFQIHDPSPKDRRGNHPGRSYRSAIFYTNEEQHRVALDTIADV